MSFKETSAGFQANQLARQFFRGLAEALGPLGLQPAQFMTLVELAESPGLTQTALARTLCVEQATMAGTLKRMERDGLITRERMAGDARAQRIVATPRAAELRDRAMGLARQVNRQALRGFSDAEVREALAYMRRMGENLRAAQEEAGGAEAPAGQRDARGRRRA